MILIKVLFYFDPLLCIKKLKSDSTFGTHTYKKQERVLVGCVSVREPFVYAITRSSYDNSISYTNYWHSNTIRSCLKFIDSPIFVYMYILGICRRCVGQIW